MNNKELYRVDLLDRLANPVNQGILDKPDLTARLVNPLCGDEVKIDMKVRNGVIEQAVYSGNGCAISQVTASFLTEKITGSKVSAIKKIKENDIFKLLGVKPAPARLKCALLSLAVLKKATE